MKFFVIHKATGNIQVKEYPDKTALYIKIEAAGKNPEDYEALTPEEYQDIEIKKARKEATKEEYPELSNLFPRAAENPKFHSAMSDVLTIPGRSYAALADATLAGEYSGGKFGENYSKSLGETEAGDRERSLPGGILQGMLRDEMLVPGMMIGFGTAPLAGKTLPMIGSKLPATIGQAAKWLEKPAGSLAGKFAKRDVLIPVIGGIPAGLGTAALRPALTGEANAVEDIASGVGGNLAMHNVIGLGRLGLRLAKTGYSKLMRNSLKAANDINRFAKKKPLEIIGEIEKDYGVNIDDWKPGMVPESPEATSFYDVAKYAIGQKLPTETLAEGLGSQNNVGNKALLKSTSKKGATDIEKSYRSQMEIADDISEKLSIDNLIGDGLNVWHDFLNNSKDIIPEEKIYSLFKALERPINEGLLEPHEIKKINTYLKVLERKQNSMTAKDLDLLRQRMGDALDLNRAATDTKMGRIEQAALNDAYHLARDINIENAMSTGNEAAAAAYQRNAVALKLRDDVLHALKADKGDKRDVSFKMGNLFKNRGNEESNSVVTQHIFKTLEKLDSYLGTNYAEQISNAYMADQLSPKGKEFKIPNYNTHMTDKGFTNDHITATKDGKTMKSAYINVLRSKAGDIKTASKRQLPIIGDRPLPTHYWGNPYGGSDERNRLINSGALD